MIDKDFKLQELLIFAKPFSEVAHSAVEIEKAIKIGLSDFGIGLYDTTKTPIVDTVSKHAIFHDDVTYVPYTHCWYLYRLAHALWDLHRIKQVQ